MAKSWATLEKWTIIRAPNGEACKRANERALSFEKPLKAEKRTAFESQLADFEDHTDGDRTQSRTLPHR